jgi:hypothetical protein
MYCNSELCVLCGILGISPNPRCVLRTEYRMKFISQEKDWNKQYKFVIKEGDSQLLCLEYFRRSG